MTISHCKPDRQFVGDNLTPLAVLIETMATQTRVFRRNYLVFSSFYKFFNSIFYQFWFLFFNFLFQI